MLGSLPNPSTIALDFVEPVAARAVCTSESHERAKADPGLWDAMRCIGVQPAFGDGDEPDLELRNCPLCNSTLCREVRP